MTTENKEFIEMRQQIELLKIHLNNQKIVSDKLIRDTIRNKTKDINRNKRLTFVCAAICLVAYPLLACSHTLSNLFALYTCIIMLVCILATIYIHKPVDKLNFMTNDLITVAGTMARFKRYYKYWQYYATPILIIPWLIWACYEFAAKHHVEGINPLWMTLPLLLGCAIGGAIGYYYHRKAVNAAQNIIDQIEEIKHELLQTDQL